MLLRVSRSSSLVFEKDGALSDGIEKLYDNNETVLLHVQADMLAYHVVSRL
jgi:hypothetical protein